MKNILKHTIAAAAVLMALCLAASCSDWTDTESLKQDKPSFDKDNPGQYAKYLKELRAYRASDHKVVFSWFANPQVPASRAHHLNVIPDSVDMISLLNPDNLPGWILDEMAEVRRDKGMKVVYTISYFTVEALYKDYTDNLPQPQEGEEPVEVVGFEEFTAEYMDRTLALCAKYGYDGVSVYFAGKATNHMEDDAKAEYLSREEAFMSKAAGWVEANPDKTFVFEGTPHFLSDKSILQSAEYIVLRTTDAKTAATLTYAAITASAPEVPADRFIVTVEPYSLDEADMATGRFYDSYGNVSRAITEAAYWVATPEAQLSKAGLGIYNIQDDYYNLKKVYQYTREAIDIMNPSPKH